MKDFSNNIIRQDKTVREAMKQLNQIPQSLILFVVNDAGKLIGTLTDGDIRRNLLEEAEEDIDVPVSRFMQTQFRYLKQNQFDVQHIRDLKQKGIKFIPFINEDHEILKVFDLRQRNSILPVDAVIMAGGKGERLRPLTENRPKPLLEVGGKPILEHNIDRLNEQFGIYTFYLTVKYLGEQIEDYFRDGGEKGVNVCYHWENDKPLGTIGALPYLNHFPHDYILVMNSDILTTMDFEDFFLDFREKDADMAVATVPYRVKIPYGVLETNQDHIVDLKEKPTYTYYSNGGIYLLKKEVIEQIPEDTFYNATDLMEKLMNNGGKVTHYPVLGYWLDIGKQEDYERAKEDIEHLNL